MRATITSFGPVLLSKVLGLDPTQESSLGRVFTPPTGPGCRCSTDLRALITLEDEGGDVFLGELELAMPSARTPDVRRPGTSRKHAGRPPETGAA